MPVGVVDGPASLVGRARPGAAMGPTRAVQSVSELATSPEAEDEFTMRTNSASPLSAEVTEPLVPGVSRREPSCWLSVGSKSVTSMQSV